MRRIGPYEIREELASGGMGVVYRANDPRVGREVALKLLRSEGFADGEERARFQREAEALARLKHPGVVTVHELGWERGRPYLVMELVPGEPLSKKLERKELFAPREAAALVARLARALSAAHALGVLHRDLKPANVLIRPGGEPTLVDFGLAKLSDAAQSLTETGTLLGTPAYMAPEQARGEKQGLGTHTDVYGLGAILYALLTGEPPYSGSSVLVILSKVVKERPLAPRALRPEIEAGLEAICLRCLEKEPAKRLPSCAALAEALEADLRGEQLARPRRALLLVGTLAVSLVVGLVLLIGVGGLGPEPSQGAELPKEEGRREAQSEGPTLSREVAQSVAEEGRRALSQGDFARAGERLDRALRGHADFVVPALDRAKLHLLAGDPQGALDALRGFGGRAGPEVLWLRAEALARLGEHEEGLALCDRVVAADKSRAEAYLARGRVRLIACREYLSGDALDPQAGRGLVEAMRDAQLATDGSSLKPSRLARARALLAETRMELASISMARGDQEDALKRLRSAMGDLKKVPARNENLTELELTRTNLMLRWAELFPGQRTARLGDLDGSLSKLLDRPRRNPVFLAQRGVIRSKLGKREEALADLEAAVAAWPDYAPGHAELVRYWLEAPGRRQEVLGRAEQALKSALQLCPRAPLLQRLRDELAKAQARALPSESSSAGEAARRGTAAWWRGDYAVAQLAFERALELDSQCAEALLGRARGRLTWEDQEGALRDLESIPGEDPEVLAEIAIVLSQMSTEEQITRANRTVDRLYELQPAGALPHLVQGWVRLNWVASHAAKSRGTINVTKDWLRRASENADEAQNRAGASWALRARAHALQSRIYWQRSQKDPTLAGDALFEVERALDHAPPLRPGSVEPGLMRALREVRQAHSMALIRMGWLSPSPAQRKDHLMAALRTLKAQLDLEPRNPEFTTFLGYVHLLLQSHGEALRAFDQAATLWPNYPGPLVNRAALRIKRAEGMLADAVLGKLEAPDRIRAELRLAEDDLRVALQSNPHWVQAQTTKKHWEDLVRKVNDYSAEGMGR